MWGEDGVAVRGTKMAKGYSPQTTSEMARAGVGFGIENHQHLAIHKWKNANWSGHLSKARIVDQLGYGRILLSRKLGKWYGGGNLPDGTLQN